MSDMKNNGNGFMDLLERLGMVTKKEETVQVPAAEDRVDMAPEAVPMRTAEPPAPVPEKPEPAPASVPPVAPPQPKPEPPPIVREERPAPVPESPRRSSGVDLDKGVEVEELYAACSLPVRGTNTIFLVEEYLKSLPDTLPIEMRRQIILRIIEASGMDAGALLADGKDRIRQLELFSSDFGTRTMGITRECESEIAKLEQYIVNLRNVIADRSNLHKKQVLLIENEIQRLRKLTGIFSE